MNCLYCKKETHNPKFCCLSCSATYNNKLYPKREKGVVYPSEVSLFLTKNKDPIKCAACENYFVPDRKNRMYCSVDCNRDYFFHYVEKYNTFTQPGCLTSCSKTIRRYLIKKHGNKCTICSVSGDNWNGKPMTLVVDHIDGDAYNYNVSNIRLVCHNCDSQLPTYKGRNKGKSTRKYTITQK